MKACFARWVKKSLTLCSRALSLLLAVVMLCNMGTDALGAVLSSHEDLTALVEAGVERAENAAPVSPDKFLADLRTDLESAMEQDAPETDPSFTKYTPQQFLTKYQQEVAAEYNRQEKALTKAVTDSLTEFDAQADAERNRLMGGMLSGATEAGELAQLELYIQQERAKYKEYLGGEQAKSLTELQAERDKALTKKQRQQAYARYEQEFDKAVQESQEAQLAFYRELVHQILINYQQAGGSKSSYKVKEDFVSILTYLSSLSNKNEIFVGEDKEKLQHELWLNFTVKSHACVGTIETTYKANSTWGSAAIGGSPSAGRVFDVQMNKEYVFKLANEKACNVALSALIPFANLNGEGWKITNFMQDNFDNPLFGQILLVGTKALMLTNNGGISALDKFVDKAIEKENDGSEKTTWDMLDIFTAEGLIKALSFDGKYFSHNVSSAAERNPGEPNVWEDVAEMLIQKNTPAATDILRKAVKQCKVLSKTNRAYGSTTPKKQVLDCRGIYPFLFGVITQKPELVNEMYIQPLFPEKAGKYQEAYRDGVRDFYVTETEARQNRAYNRRNGLEYKTTKGELIAGFFYHNMFEDLYPSDKQRMDSKLAGVALLNPKGYIKAYSKDSDRYKKLQNEFNAKIVFVALGAVFDYVISLLLFKDVAKLLFKAGALVKGATSAMKVRQVIMGYKLVPNSLGKSAAIAHALQAKNLGLVHLKSYKTFITKISNIKTKAVKIRTYPSKVVARFREANAPRFHFENPNATRFGGAAARGGAKKGPAGAGQWTTQDWAYARAAWRNPVEATPLATSQINNFRDFYSTFVARPAAKAWDGIKNYWKEGGWPGFTKDGGGGTPLNKDRFTFTLRDKKGNIIPVEDVSVENGVLFINGKMAKTFKAYLPMDQLEALGALAREESVSLGFDGMWIKLVRENNQSKLARIFSPERIIALDKNVVTVPLYDATGNMIVHVGFNPGIKADAALLKMLKGANPTAKLVFKEGKVHLFDLNGKLIRTLDEFKEISIPKTAFGNVMKGGKLPFLEKLFSLNEGDSGALRIEETGHKLFFPMAVNLLSYSAAASALTMTLEEAGWSPVMSTLAGLTLPYVTAPLAPLLTPFVHRFGARTVLNSSLLLASGSLIMATSTGWRGHGIVKGEDGKDKIVAPAWSLLANALLTGLAATGVRASSNLVVKAYETSKGSLIVSMMGKSIGAMSTSLVPAVAYWAKKENVDFSGSYPWMLGATLLTATGLRMFIPKKANPTFFADMKGAGRKPFKEPWKVLAKPEVWPYVAGITLMSSLEGYVYFKGLSAWDRDKWGSFDWAHDANGKPNANAKFLAALSTAIPQLWWRWSGKGIKAFEFGRKGAFHKGVANSAALALGGGMLFAFGDENNIPLGILSGLMIGTGTANIYQYTQKLLLGSIGRYNTALAGMGKAAMIDEKTAMTVYSAGNFGLALPAIPAIFANQLKTGNPESGIPGESEVMAAKHTTMIPLTAYITGLGFVVLSELNGLKYLKPAVSRTWLAPARILKPAVLGTVLGADVSLWIKQGNNFNQVLPSLNGNKQAQLPTLQTPALSVKPFHSDTPSLTSPLLQNPLQGNGQGGFQLNLMNGQSLLSPLPQTPLPEPEPVPAE